MRFFYLSFNEWRKLTAVDRNKYLFLSTAKTDPVYFTGEKFYPFVPSDELFFDACKNFSTSNFEQRYNQQIQSLDKIKILEELQKFKKQIIIFLVWEAENKQSQRDIFMPWLTNTPLKDISAFSFTKFLTISKIEKQNNILFSL